MISAPPRMVIQQNMERIASFYHASATTPHANHSDFFNTHACLQQLRQMPRIGQGAINSETPPGGFDWLAPRFYRGKSGLRGLFTNSPLPSGDGPTEYNESGLYRVARAGPRW